jgi:hypothetical protein
VHPLALRQYDPLTSRFRHLPVWLFAAGCSELVVSVPPDLTGIRSGILVIEENERTQVFGLDEDDMGRLGGSIILTEVDAHLTLLLYELTLGELDLPRRTIPLGTEGVARPLPPQDRVYEANVDRDQIAWSESSDRPDRLNMIALMPTTIEACLAEGCYVDESHADQLWCSRPCPSAVSPPIIQDLTPPTPVASTWSPTISIDLGSCPQGRFADSVPAGAVFVDPDAPPGGDGSRAQPYATLADVPAARASEVALSKGTHAAIAVVPDGWSLYGACAAETIVAGRVTAGGTVHFQDLSLTAPTEALIVESGATVDLQRVSIESPLVCVKVQGGSLEIRDAHLAGSGIEAAGSISIARALIEAGTFDGVIAEGRVVIEDVVVRSDPEVAHAALVFTDSDVDMRRVVIESAKLGVSIAGGIVRVEDLIVRGFEGVSARNSTITVARARFEESDGLAFVLNYSFAELADVIIAGAPSPASKDNSGLFTIGSTISLARIEISDLPGGLFLIEGTHDLQDVAVLRTTRFGGLIGEKSNFRLVRGRFVDNDPDGVVVFNQGNASLESVEITGGIAGARFESTLLRDPRTVDLTDVAISGARGVGLCIGVGSIANVDRFAVEDVRSEAAPGCTGDVLPGTGVYASVGASLVMQNFRASRNAVGVALDDAGGMLTDGELRDNDVGAALGPNVDHSAATIRVSFSGNTIPLRVN